MNFVRRHVTGSQDLHRLPARGRSPPRGWDNIGSFVSVSARNSTSMGCLNALQCRAIDSAPLSFIHVSVQPTCVQPQVGSLWNPSQALLCMTLLHVPSILQCNQRYESDSFAVCPIFNCNGNETHFTDGRFLRSAL